MNGTVLCTLDDSDGVGAAIQTARQLALRFGARMVLVSIAGGFRTDSELGESLSSRQARSGAERRLQHFVSEYELSPEEHRVATGDPAEAVATIAAEEAADLIVVPARRGLLGRTLRSSLAGELAGTAPCPVVIALPEAAETAPDRVSSAQGLA